MKKSNLSKVMKRAWEIKKEDKRNIFGLCLKMAWEEVKNVVTTAEKLLNKGLSVWEKYGKKRIYVDVMDSEYGIANVVNNYKAYRGINCYYDCTEKCFVYTSMSSSKKASFSEWLDFLCK